MPYSITLNISIEVLDFKTKVTLSQFLSFLYLIKINIDLSSHSARSKLIYKKFPGGVNNSFNRFNPGNS